MAALRLNWTVLAAALLIVPLWIAATPAMPDYPARLAGFYLIGGLSSSFYTVHWAAIPNLAAEVVVPALGHAMGMENALALFLSVAVAMWVAGPVLIHRALYGHGGLMPLLAAFFAYNANFMWGFFNYYFTVGLCLIAFAGWIASENWRRTPRLALFGLVTIGLYFSHILGAALFLLLVGCYEVTRKPVGLRALLVEMAVLGVPVGALFLLRMRHMAGAVEFDIAGTFLRRLGSTVLWRFETSADWIIAGLIVLFAVGLWRGFLTVHRRMRVAVVVLGLVAFLVPEVAMGGWGLHLRFPAVAAALLFAATGISLPRRAAAVLAGATLALLAALSATLAQHWRAHDRDVRQLRQALDRTPRGIALMTAVDTDHMKHVRGAIYWHLEEFALIDRGDATALMFTTNGQSLISPSPRIASFVARSAHEGSPPQLKHLAALAAGDVRNPKIRQDLRYLLHFPCHYDEVLLIHASGKPAKAPALLRPREEGRFFTLYDVAKPGRCSTISATRP